MIRKWCCESTQLGSRRSFAWYSRQAMTRPNTNNPIKSWGILTFPSLWLFLINPAIPSTKTMVRIPSISARHKLPPNRKINSASRLINARLMPIIWANETRGSWFRFPNQTHQASPGSSSNIIARTVTATSLHPCQSL